MLYLCQGVIYWRNIWSVLWPVRNLPAGVALLHGPLDLEGHQQEEEENSRELNVVAQ